MLFSLSLLGQEYAFLTLWVWQPMSLGLALLWTQCISLIIAFGLDHVICIGQRDVATHDLSIGLCMHVWAFPVVLQPFQLEKMPSVATSPRKMRDKWRKFEMNPQLEPNLHYIGQIPAHAQTHEQDINVNIIWHWHLRAFKSNIIIACLRYMHKCTKRHVQDCLWQYYLKNIAKNLKQYK